MTRTVQMELLKALVAQCLSAAAEEIVRIVQKAIVDQEEDKPRPLTDHGRQGQMDMGKMKKKSNFFWKNHQHSEPRLFVYY